MPFTLCHLAIVLPLHARARRLTSLPALVIGSMAPDFVYFLPFAADGYFTHSLPGIFLYCLPAGLLVYFIYQALLRDAFIEWAPAAVSARMRATVPWMNADVRTVGIVLVSLLIGAASHIAWDAFTHPNTAVVRHVDVLRMQVALGSYSIPLFKVLQHMSSLVGFIVIAAYVRRWLAVTEASALSHRPMSGRRSLYVLVAIALAGLGGGAAGLMLKHPKSGEHALFNFVVTGMAMAALAVLLLCVARKVIVSRR